MSAPTDLQNLAIKENCTIFMLRGIISVINSGNASQAPSEIRRKISDLAHEAIECIKDRQLTRIHQRGEKLRVRERKPNSFLKVKDRK